MYGAKAENSEGSEASGECRLRILENGESWFFIPPRGAAFIIDLDDKAVFDDIAVFVIFDNRICRSEN